MNRQLLSISFLALVSVLVPPSVSYVVAFVASRSSQIFNVTVLPPSWTVSLNRTHCPPATITDKTPNL